MEKQTSPSHREGNGVKAPQTPLWTSLSQPQAAFFLVTTITYSQCSVDKDHPPTHKVLSCPAPVPTRCLQRKNVQVARTPVGRATGEPLPSSAVRQLWLYLICWGRDWLERRPVNSMSRPAGEAKNKKRQESADAGHCHGSSCCKCCR